MENDFDTTKLFFSIRLSDCRNNDILEQCLTIFFSRHLYLCLKLLQYTRCRNTHKNGIDTSIWQKRNILCYNLCFIFVLMKRKKNLYDVSKNFEIGFFPKNSYLLISEILEEKKYFINDLYVTLKGFYFQ